AAALLAAAALGRVLAPRLVALAERVVVLVPEGGVVLADRAALAEPVLFPKRTIQALGPAEEGTGALDLTERAAGLVLELRVAPAATLARRRGRAGVDTVHAHAVLFCPLRPGAFLAEARARGLPIG
ncbi:MAG: hypothetical protein ACKVWR_16550, partial [Acidimicrobiales bacterium]